MKQRVYTLNSFAKSEEGGNPAGVVLEADLLDEAQMRQIAKHVGYSETAFVMQSQKADFRVRFFTPNEEVDLCGHATIAAFYVLAHTGLAKPGIYTQETKAGVLHVEIKEDMTILMEQNRPGYFEIINKDIIAESLRIPVEALMDELPVQVVSTGIKDILVPVKSIDLLNQIVPDYEKISEISKKYHVTGYHVFTLETLFQSIANCRNFAPLYGISEESATGTSNGALACYLFKYGEMKTKQATGIVVEQGYSMKKPSEITISLEIKNEEIIGVKVGGKAMGLSTMDVFL